MPYEKLSPETERIASEIIDAGYKVHKTLGPGLLESVYEVCLEHELKKQGLRIERQVVLPIIYDDVTLDAGLRLDLLVEGKIIVELKSVESLLPIHTAQCLTYLKLSNKRLALLINFKVPKIKDGIKRIIL